MWLVALVSAAFLGYPPLLRIIALTAVAASIIFFIVHETLRARLSRRLLAHFAIVAAHGRLEKLTREYQRYLTAMA
ncbi:hypothetical protein ASD65_06310 [Microbacterium sp. Root61]|nr:hypothetical protein ASD65_06310 [Microbacterium sp. Root61]